MKTVEQQFQSVFQDQIRSRETISRRYAQQQAVQKKPSTSTTQGAVQGGAK